MTIAASFQFDDGVLFCADTQLSGEIYRQQGLKIIEKEFESLGDTKIVFAVSGNLPYATMAIDECVEQIKAEISHPKEATQRNLYGWIRTSIKFIYDNFIFKHPDRRLEDKGFDFLIGIYSHTEGLRTYWTTETAINAYCGYKSIGAGRYLADYLVQPMYTELGLTLDGAVMIAAHMLKQVKLHDSSCGGGSQFIVMRRKGALSGVEQFDLQQVDIFSVQWTELLAGVFPIFANRKASPKQTARAEKMLMSGIHGMRRHQQEALDKNQATLKQLIERLQGR